MGTKRKSNGTAVERDGRWYCVLSLPPGGRDAPRHWERIPTPPGEKLTRGEARAYARELQARVDAGWDPRVPVPPNVVQDPLVPGYAMTWIATETYDSAPADKEKLERYLPGSPLENLRVRDTRPRHAIAFIRWLCARRSERGGTLAPRTVRNIVDVVRRALNSAVIDELLPANPFTAVRGELPSIVDKDPTARAGWEFSWLEVALLVYDHRIPIDRRVLNGTKFGFGARISELAVLRWSDWDRDAQPLSRMNVRRARKSISRREGATKTNAVKPCPVHPALATILTDWYERGWSAHYGRAPKPDDLIVPTTAFAPRHENKANEQFKEDCSRVEIRPRHQHCARHTFVSRVQDDGADPNVVRWITHAPPRSSWDGYTRQDWGRLCTELAKLRFPVGLGVEAINANGSNGSKSLSTRSIDDAESHALQPTGTDPVSFKSSRPDKRMRRACNASCRLFLFLLSVRRAGRAQRRRRTGGIG